MSDEAQPPQAASQRDILRAWQAGKFGYREAMTRTGCRSLFELYEACRKNRVRLRKTFTKHELEVVDRVVADLEAPIDQTAAENKK